MGRMRTCFVTVMLPALGLAQVLHDTFAVLHRPAAVSIIPPNDGVYSPQDIGDLLCQSLGLPSLRGGTVKAVAQPLHAPKASVVFVVSGVDMGREDYNDAALWAKIQRTGEDDLSTLVTILTGESYRVHQLAGRRWLEKDGMVETAFDTEDNQPMTGNIADYITQLLPDSLAVSLSGDKLLAKGAGARLGKNALVLSWEKESQSVEVLRGDSEPGALRLSVDDILEELPHLLADGSAAVSFDRTNRQLTYGQGVFDLHDEVNLLLVAELVAAKRLLETMAAKAANIDHPHFVAISFAGPQLVSQAHGKDTELGQAAKAIVTDFINKVGQQAAKGYNGEAVVSVIGIGSRNGSETALRLRRRQAAENDDEGAGDDKPKAPTASPAVFQIMLWLVVGLVVAVWITVYMCMTIDPGYDSVIYRTTGGGHQKAD